MKKFAKLLSVFVVCVLGLFALTSCSKKESDKVYYEVKAEGTVIIATTTEGEKTVNHIYVGSLGAILAGQEDKTSEDNNFLGLYADEKLYLNGATIPAGTYEVIYRTAEMPGLDNKGIFGDYFAGWYQTEDLRNAEGNLNKEIKLSDRVITLQVADLDSDHILHAYYITFLDAILVTIVCILIVFLMLVIIMGLVMLLRFIAPKQATNKEEPAKPVVKAEPKKQFKLENIKDEDMMVAALVATIDYHDETNEDVRVVSIKQIG